MGNARELGRLCREHAGFELLRGGVGMIHTMLTERRAERHPPHDLVARIIPFSSNSLCRIRDGAFAQIRSVPGLFCEIAIEAQLASPGSP
jgi:hypothetical protein